jgi:hypothetical protein
MANSMIGGVSDKNVWYVDSRASNHMTSHGEWFKDTKDLKTPSFVETGDDITHPIAQIGKVPCKMCMQNGLNKVLERCTSCSNHNKKIGLCRPNGGTRFTSDI